MRCNPRLRNAMGKYRDYVDGLDYVDNELKYYINKNVKK